MLFSMWAIPDYMFYSEAYMQRQRLRWGESSMAQALAKQVPVAMVKMGEDGQPVWPQLMSARAFAENTAKSKVGTPGVRDDVTNSAARILGRI